MPTARPVLILSSVSLMIESWTSSPEFSARVLGMTRRASAKASTPSFARPSMVFLSVSRRYCEQAISKAPAPGTMQASCDENGARSE